MLTACSYVQDIIDWIVWISKRCGFQLNGAVNFV
jgi:hypothetical protein